MKKIFYLICGLAFFQSCKEQIPSGLVLVNTVSVDTSYVSNIIETPQIKKVVIEELTGATCVNCPAGTSILNNFVAQNPGRIILTGIHSGFLTTPPSGAKYDFRNTDADDFRKFFNEGDPSKPGATFDRVPATSGGSAGNHFISKGQTGADWIAILPTRLSVPTPVNIHLTSTYDASENKATIKVKLAFTSDVTEKLGLTLYVLESGRDDKQLGQDINGLPIEIEDYKFEHVLRKFITPIGGDLILDSLTTKVKGRVLERTIQFTPNLYNAANNVNGLIPDSCEVVGIVHKVGASKEILHGEEIKLK